MLNHRLTITLAAAALAVTPSAASAHNWFGSSLNHEPANAGASCADDGVMGPALCTHVGSYYPGTSGIARAPRNGRVAKIKVRAQGATTMTFKVVSVRNVAADHKSGQARATARSRTVTVHGPTDDQAQDGIYPTETFNVNLPVKKGQEIAVDTTRNTAEYCTDGTPGQLLFSPALGLGSGFRSSGGHGDCLMLVQALLR